MDIAEFATRQLALLDKELQAELRESQQVTSTHAPKVLARAGLAVLNLTVQAQRTGLGGKTLLDLVLDGAIATTTELPSHGIRVGDIVRAAAQPKGSERKSLLDHSGANGVVVKVTSNNIVVALDREDDNVAGKLWLLKLANDVTYKRMNQFMARLQTNTANSRLTSVLFGQATHTSSEEAVEFKTLLNESQQAAIRFALGSHDIALIHGPPGTGKTHTLNELILQFVQRDLRVLVCGPSNISVDNIVERLSPEKVPMVRLGHPARLLPTVLNHSLEILTKTSETATLVQDIRKELDVKQSTIRKTRNGRERKVIYTEMKDLRKEYKERETKCVSEIIRQSKVVLATLHGAGGYHLKDQTFDVVVIDEASQALEAACWVPILSSKASRLVIAGDHLQLPPTVKSKNPALEATMFDRLLSLHGPAIKRLLTTQYRMHEKIMRFPSKKLYESKLVAADAVKARLLSHLPNVIETDDTNEPLVFYDTQGDDFSERVDDSGLGSSKSNELEAELVKKHVEGLIKAGVSPEDIAVVTPYNGQLDVLSGLLENVELGSIDGFQGREKEAVVVSLVRSNAEREVGFLGEKRRLNVAMTRPKRHLCVIGDSQTISSGGNFLKGWMAFLEEEADLRYPSN